MRWARFIARRILENLLLILFLALAMFVLFRLVPGDPVASIVSPELSEQARQQTMKDWGLTGSLLTQLLRYLEGLLTLDFGQSFAYHRPVWEILTDKFVNTIVLVIPSVTMAAILGLWIGLRAGVAPRGLADRLTVWLPPILRGIPPFWLGILLLMVFAYGFSWFPIGGMRSLGAPDTTFGQRFLTLDFGRHLFLPVLCLTITSLPE